jgi:hypothetical protein
MFCMFSDNSSDSDERPSDSTPMPDAGAESLDSVPDFEQEHRGLDPQTQRILDSIEDDTREFSLDASADQLENVNPKRLERLAAAARQIKSSEAEGSEDAVEGAQERREREARDGVPDSLQEQIVTLTASDQDDLVPEAYMYRLVADLPVEVLSMANDALAQIESTDPIYGLQLQAAFQANDIEQIAAKLHSWTSEFLPLPSQLVSVHSEVWGSQQYLAGWRMNNASALHIAQNELTKRLGGLIVPVPNTIAMFRAFIAILEYTPANKFPDLVAYLHEQFSPLEFQVTSIRLLRKPMPRFERRVPEQRRTWQTLSVFPSGSHG